MSIPSSAEVSTEAELRLIRMLLVECPIRRRRNLATLRRALRQMR